MTPPVSGCSRRRRSSSESSLPTTSMTTGPRGMLLACDIATRLQNDARACERSLVADRHMVADNASLCHERVQLGMKLETGFACPVLDDADALKRHGITETRSHRFGER